MLCDTHTEIHHLLQSQHEEIASLRAKLSAECEDKPQHTPEGVDVAELEQQLAKLHKQYQDQVEQIQSSIRAKDGEFSLIMLGFHQVFRIYCSLSESDLFGQCLILRQIVHHVVVV